MVNFEHVIAYWEIPILLHFVPNSPSPFLVRHAKLIISLLSLCLQFFSITKIKPLSAKSIPQLFRYFVTIKFHHKNILEWFGHEDCCHFTYRMTQ